MELEKVQELCKDFCTRYKDCLRHKMHPDNLLQGTGQADEFDLDLSSDLSSNEDEDYPSYVTASSAAKSKAKKSAPNRTKPNGRRLVINEDIKVEQSNCKTNCKAKEEEPDGARSLSSKLKNKSKQIPVNRGESLSLNQNLNPNGQLGNSSLNSLNSLQSLGSLANVKKENLNDDQSLANDESSANDFGKLLLDNLRDSMTSDIIADSKVTANDLRTFYEQMLKLNQINESQFDPQLNRAEQFGSNHFPNNADPYSQKLLSDQISQQLLNEQLASLNQFKGQQVANQQKPSKSQKTSTKNSNRKSSKRLCTSEQLPTNLSLTDQPSTSNHFLYDALIGQRDELMNGLSGFKTSGLLDKNLDDFDLETSDPDGQPEEGCSSKLHQSNRKSHQKRGILPKHATQVMRSWLFQHIVVST